jgi:hypothetical protein
VKDYGSGYCRTKQKIDSELHASGFGRDYHSRRKPGYLSRYDDAGEKEYNRSSARRDSGYGRSMIYDARTRATILQDKASPGKALKKLLTNPIGFCKDTEKVRRELQAEEKEKKIREKLDRRGYRYARGSDYDGYEEEDRLLPEESYSRAASNRRWH